MRRIIPTVSICGATVFAFAAGFPPFDDITEVDLTLHMLQHVVIILAGVMLTYPIFKVRGEKNGKWAPWGSLAAASALIVLWHLPGPWDAAVLNPAAHVVERVSFLAVGALAGSWMLQLSDSVKIEALFAAFFAHVVYAVVLISPWNVQVYPLYSAANQVILGWALLLTGPSLVVGIAYLVARNPGWLERLPQEGNVSNRKTMLDRVRVPRWVTPVLTSILIVTSVVYFGVVALSLGGAQGAAGPQVHIVDSPVSWQYAPQRIVVVIGLNNTVTWTSSSISYDGVTSRTGQFDSGPIPPGGSFSHTFRDPGVYDYYCVYHPWMTGQVEARP